eukprot:1492185-Karenia_brevis.AAC.1
MGLPAAILQPLRGMYSGLHRRFRCGAGVGQRFLSTNGILQGCPLSVILVNALVSVWALAVEAEVHDVKPDCFADDTSASC